MKLALFLANIPAFKGYNNGSFDWGVVTDKVIKFVQQYVYGGLGLLVFIACVWVGMMIATSGFAQRPDDRYHKSKTTMITVIFGILIIVFAVPITIAIANML